MDYLALACDYDGTLAHDGVVDAATIAALERLRASGRRLLMVTGRELPDLRTVFDRLDLFDSIVAENGALLMRPGTGDEVPLAEPPPPTFAAALRERGVKPLSVGRVIVASVEPHDAAMLASIRDLGLELQIIFNKGSVMVLPAGVTKATGLAAALEDLKLSPLNTVGIGDAENDHAFLSACGCSVAVANALPAVKDTADLVTKGARGDGVQELVEALLTDDLKAVDERLVRRQVALGELHEGGPLLLPVRGGRVLVAGSSGGGKTTLVTGLAERLIAKGHQVAIVDPEGDYGELDRTVVLGDGNRAPTPAELVEVLAHPDRNVIASLLAIDAEARPRFLEEFATALTELRRRTGRPHWLVLDEAHHLMPKADARPLPPLADQCGIVMITVYPEEVAPAALELIDNVVITGTGRKKSLARLAKILGRKAPSPPEAQLDGDMALFWKLGRSKAQAMTVLPPLVKRKRHSRKYAEGKLEEDRSFYFRGPAKKLNLRAHNLNRFLEIADGVDDETWLHHLKKRDYERWFATEIGDDKLAREAADAAARHDGDAAASRAAIRAAIERRYTQPAKTE